MCVFLSGDRTRQHNSQDSTQISLNEKDQQIFMLSCVPGAKFATRDCLVSVGMDEEVYLLFLPLGTTLCLISHTVDRITKGRNSKEAVAASEAFATWLHHPYDPPNCQCFAGWCTLLSLKIG